MNRMPTPGDSGRRRREDLSLPRDAMRVLLAVLIFFAVGRAHQHYSFLGAFRPALLLFVGAVGYAFLKPRAIRLENSFRVWPTRVVMALAVLACLSVPFGISIGSAGRFMLEAYSKVLITFFLLVAAIRSARDLKLFVWAYVLGCGFLVYISLFTFSLQNAGGVYRLNNLYMYDANDMGLVLVVGLPLALALFQNSGKWGKWISGTILVGIGASLARSGSRGGFLGLLAVGILLLFLLRQVSVLKRVGFVSVVVFGMVFMAPPGYWEQMETLTEPTQDYNWQAPTGRKALAKRGMGYMFSHPLFGVGVGNFARADWFLSEVRRNRQLEGAGFKMSAAHNSFVQMGAEMGIPGLLLFCALLFGGIGGMMRLRSRAPPGWKNRGPDARFVHDLALYLPVSLVGFAVTGFFVSFAYHDVTYILVAFVAGVYVCARDQWKRQPAAPPHPLRRAGASASTGAGRLGSDDPSP